MKQKYYIRLENKRTRKVYILGTLLITGAVEWLITEIPTAWERVCTFDSKKSAKDAIHLILGLKLGKQYHDADEFVSIELLNR